MQHRLKSFHWPQGLTSHWCLEDRKMEQFLLWTGGALSTNLANEMADASGRK